MFSKLYANVLISIKVNTISPKFIVRFTSACFSTLESQNKQTVVLILKAKYGFHLILFNLYTFCTRKKSMALEK